MISMFSEAIQSARWGMTVLMAEFTCILNLNLPQFWRIQQERLVGHLHALLEQENLVMVTHRETLITMDIMTRLSILILLPEITGLQRIIAPAATHLFIQMVR